MEILTSVRRIYISFKFLVNDFVYSFGRAALLLLVEVQNHTVPVRERRRIKVKIAIINSSFITLHTMDWPVTFLCNARLLNQDLPEQGLARKFTYTLIHQSVEGYIKDHHIFISLCMEKYSIFSQVTLSDTNIVDSSFLFCIFCLSKNPNGEGECLIHALLCQCLR